MIPVGRAMHKADAAPPGFRTLGALIGPDRKGPRSLAPVGSRATRLGDPCASRANRCLNPAPGWIRRRMTSEPNGRASASTAARVHRTLSISALEAR